VFRLERDLGCEPLLTSCDGDADVRPVAIGPGGLDESGADVAVAGVADVAAMLALAGGVLRWHEPGEAHQ
jgi:hypothetical protein